MQSLPRSWLTARQYNPISANPKTSQPVRRGSRQQSAACSAAFLELFTGAARARIVTPGFACREVEGRLRSAQWHGDLSSTLSAPKSGNRAYANGHGIGRFLHNPIFVFGIAPKQGFAAQVTAKRENGKQKMLVAIRLEKLLPGV